MTVRMGVLSTARIATEKVIPAIGATAACDVVALASRDAARATAAAERLGIERVHGSYGALLADPEVDAVYIPLPNHLHAEWTIRAAQAGKHVLCEKPLALDADEARRMIAACRDAGVVLMEAFMYRLHPQWRLTRELVTSGRIGELQAIQTFFAYNNPDPANIRNIARYGGGALMDIGCYAIDLSRMLFADEPVAVTGSVRIDPASGVDVLSSGLLTFPGDRHAGFTCGMRTQPGQWVHLAGTGGRLTVELPFNAPPDRSLRLLLAGPDPRAAPEVVELPPADQYTLQAEAFAAAVRGEAELPTPPENGVANLEVIAALRASSPTRR